MKSALKLFRCFSLSCSAQQVNAVLPVGSQCCGLPPVMGYVIFIRNPVLWLVNAEYLSLGHVTINEPCWQTNTEIPSSDICVSVYVVFHHRVKAH